MQTEVSKDDAEYNKKISPQESAETSCPATIILHLES